MSDLHAELGQAGPHWAGKERGNSQPEVGEEGERKGRGGIHLGVVPPGGKAGGGGQGGGGGGGGGGWLLLLLEALPACPRVALLIATATDLDYSL